jgi:NAD-dependent SIR2 family protein deacetylase
MCRVGPAMTPVGAHHGTPECECEVCRGHRPFDMPDELVRAVIHGEVVVFAGAGISTENSLVMPTTLFEDVGREVGANLEGESFPEVMERYAQEHGRPSLLQRIRDRLDYIGAFPELYGRATAFHRELATVPFLTDIVTTNWDTSFEDVCAALPLVVPDDYAFWNAAGRKVLKIHGSISNWGTIVATSQDYDRCYRRLRAGVVGSTLKHLLATKRAVFVGYSLRDPDFLKIYGYLKREMGEVLPRSYIVTLDENLESGPGSSMVIQTSGDYFVARLKEQLVEDELLIPDEVFAGIPMLLTRIRAEHERLSEGVVVRQHPEAVYAHSYQDGLIHAFERIMARCGSGEYSLPGRVAGLIGGYEDLRRTKLRQRKYWDVAYIDGYVNGLMALLVDRGALRQLPAYYVFGAGDVRTYAQYIKAVKKAGELHKTAYRVAGRLIAPFEEDTTVLHHTPFLL